MPWCCGKDNLETLPTLPSASLISSLQVVRASGLGRVGWSCCCRMGWRAWAQSTAQLDQRDSCRCPGINKNRNDQIASKNKLFSDDPEYFPPEQEEFAIQQLININMIVANCSNPANYFHLLRRQTALPFRKPLIVMTPKSLLRHPECRSSFDDLQPGTEFKRMILDSGSAASNPASVKKVENGQYISLSSHFLFC